MNYFGHWLDRYPVALRPRIQHLLGCTWGWAFRKMDGSTQPCTEKAIRIIVVHDGPEEYYLKLCALHVEQVIADTTPHKESSEDNTTKG